MNNTVSALLRHASERLSSAGIDNSRRDARLLLSAHMGRGEAWLIAHDVDIVPNPSDYLSLVERRANREPISRIMGHREFWSLDFEITPDVLDPRPDSETLVEATLSSLPDRNATHRLLDIGTGSGCLLLAILSERPNAHGFGTDLSVGALHCARANARRLALAERSRFVACNWGEALAGRFDIIVSNPPYIATRDIQSLDPEVALHDPTQALDGGTDGLDAYQAIIEDAPRLMPPDGRLFLEIGWNQMTDVQGLLTAEGYRAVQSYADLSGHMRVISAKPPI